MGWIDGCGLALEREGAFMGMGKAPWVWRRGSPDVWEMSRGDFEHFGMKGKSCISHGVPGTRIIALLFHCENLKRFKKTIEESAPCCAAPFRNMSYETVLERCRSDVRYGSVSCAPDNLP